MKGAQVLGKLRGGVRWEGALVLVLVAEIVALGLINPKIIQPDRLMSATADFVWIGIVALPLAIVMITGGIDISIGSMISLTSIVTGITFHATENIWLGMIIGLLAGVLAGLINGIAIIITGVHPMVITLGTQFLFAGLAIGISGLVGVSSFEGISGLPENFVQIGNGTLFGIPNPLLIFLVVAVAFAVILHSTPFGRRARLIGANPRAALYSGLPVRRVLLGSYTLTGLGAGISGIVLTSYLASARADLGISALLPAITLVVIGGVSMYGGEGTMLGVILGTFVIGFLQQGLRMLGMNDSVVTVLTGTVLVGAAALRFGTARIAEIVRNQRVRRDRKKATTAEAVTTTEEVLAKMQDNETQIGV